MKETQFLSLKLRKNIFFCLFFTYTLSSHAFEIWHTPTNTPILKEAKQLPSNVETLLRQEVEYRTSIESIQRPAVYLYIFAYQGIKNLPIDAHTFASVVKVNADKSQSWMSISWLPEHYHRTRQICIFEKMMGAFTQDILGITDCEPQSAHNYSLKETLEWAQEEEKTSGIWGPYLMKNEAYNLGLARLRELKQNKVKYIADDFKWRDSKLAINCMHAISDLTPILSSKGGLLGTGWGNWGINGAQHTLQHLYKNGEEIFIDNVNVHHYRKFNSKFSLLNRSRILKRLRSLGKS